MRNLIFIAVLLMCASCATRTPVSNENVMLALEQSHATITAGESVTFTARTTGTAGRKERIVREAKGGDIKLLNDMERYARVE